MARKGDTPEYVRRMPQEYYPQQEGLFAKMCGSIGCGGISETGLSLALDMEIGYVIKDVKKWEEDTEMDV